MSVYVDIRLRTGKFSLDASFQSDAGATAILGASGAGKTLTLRAVAGLQTPLEGKILQRGVTLYNSEQRIDLPARRRNVGYLFQDYALFPHLTVAENIAFGLKGREQAGQRESVSRMVDLLRLHGLEDRRPVGLSGGERQRVALGRALAPHPDLLLLDEPFSALDAPTRDSLVEEFISLREAIDVPMILVTHDVGEAYALAEQWKRLCMAYSPPREEQEGGFLDDMSFTSEEEMMEVVPPGPKGDNPTSSSDEFGLT